MVHEKSAESSNGAFASPVHRASFLGTLSPALIEVSARLVVLAVLWLLLALATIVWPHVGG